VVCLVAQFITEHTSCPMSKNFYFGFNFAVLVEMMFSPIARTTDLQCLFMSPSNHTDHRSLLHVEKLNERRVG
jgi:hypothetical protein